MIDSDLQRANMVESQIRPSDVTDRRILRAMAEVARHKFVPSALQSLAYMDEPVPLEECAVVGVNASRRTLFPPRTFAKLVQLTAIEPGDRVLIVGAGRGYSAAVVSRLAAVTVALECDEKLAASATTALADFANVSVVVGSLRDGATAEPPFDVIIVEGAIWERPELLLLRLKSGGRLAAVLNKPGVGHATLWTRVGDHFGEVSAFDASAGPLPGFERPMAFVL